MINDPDFVPPDPDEPIPDPPPGGATDADLGGIDVTHEYLGDGDMPFTETAGTTWARLLSYMKSFLGLYPPGRIRENVNAFTEEYYGDHTAAAWCLIYIWCMLRHVGAVAWKLAFVPWLYKIKGFRAGHSGIKAGDICAIAGFSHVGFFVTDRGSEFDLLSGNSTSGASTDAITIKRYPKSIISGYVSMTYATAPTPPPPEPPPPGADDDVVVMVIAS